MGVLHTILFIYGIYIYSGIQSHTYIANVSHSIQRASAIRRHHVYNIRNARDKSHGSRKMNRQKKAVEWETGREDGRGERGC